MPLILGANSITGGYEVDNSLRFNSGSADTLSIDMGTSSSRRIWTLSTWIKLSRDTNDDSMNIVGTGASDDQNHIGFDGSGIVGNTRIALRHFDGSSSDVHIQSNMKLNDQSAWYHVVYSVDTTQGTDTNRVKIYVNGTQVTSLATSTYPSQNFDWDFFQNGTTTYIGRRGHSSAYLLNGYLAETVWIDGTQLDPTSFGEFDEDSGIWKPIDVSGLTFGDAGFYLDYQDSSALGNDVSGNGNDFTVNNLTSIDQTTDTCTNNFATGNPLNVPTSNLPIFTNGNLTWESSGNLTSNFGGSSTIGVTQGKWYIEAKATLDETYSRNAIGISGEVSTLARNNSTTGSNSSIFYDSETGNKNVNNSGSAYGDTYTTADIIGIALDLDNGYVYFSKNGVFQNSGVPTSGATGTGGIAVTSVSSTTDGAYFIFQSDTSGVASTPSKFDFNFGNPTFTISSGNTDANGYGNFEYAVPSGYFALCSKNLAEYG
jgi:hypothetical protein